MSERRRGELGRCLGQRTVRFRLFYWNYRTYRYNDKEIYIERYKQRGSPERFIDLVRNNWEEWIIELENQENCFNYTLPRNKTITDLIPHL